MQALRAIQWPIRPGRREIALHSPLPENPFRFLPHPRKVGERLFTVNCIDPRAGEGATWLRRVRWPQNVVSVRAPGRDSRCLSMLPGGLSFDPRAREGATSYSRRRRKPDHRYVSSPANNRNKRMRLLLPVREARRSRLSARCGGRYRQGAARPPPAFCLLGPHRVGVIAQRSPNHGALIGGLGGDDAADDRNPAERCVGNPI